MNDRQSACPTVSSSGDLYVADSSPKLLVEFTPTGHVVNSWPIYVTPAGIASAPDGSILVADYGHFALDQIVNGQFTTLVTFQLNSLAGLTGAFRPRRRPFSCWPGGKLALASQNPQAALADLEASGALISPAAVGIPLSWRAPAALAALALDRLDRARALLAEERDAAERLGTARARGMALRVEGLITGGPGGLVLLEEAVDILASAPSRLELVRATVDLGAALRRAGHRSGATQRLRVGLDIAHRMGASALADRARGELLAGGSRPRRRALTGRDSLTPSEGRVAQLAASGLTNRQIAQSLFVTIKAVEAHLAHTFPKLGIATRKELAAALGQETGSEPR